MSKRVRKEVTDAPQMWFNFLEDMSDELQPILLEQVQKMPQLFRSLDDWKRCCRRNNIFDITISNFKYRSQMFSDFVHQFAQTHRVAIGTRPQPHNEDEVRSRWRKVPVAYFQGIIRRQSKANKRKRSVKEESLSSDCSVSLSYESADLSTEKLPPAKRVKKIEDSRPLLPSTPRVMIPPISEEYPQLTFDDRFEAKMKEISNYFEKHHQPLLVNVTTESI